MAITDRLLTGARNQRVVIEARDDMREWWVMFHDGHIEAFDTASAALKAVKKAAAKRNVGVTMTTIQWRGVPSGWTPPSAP